MSQASESETYPRRASRVSSVMLLRTLRCKLPKQHPLTESYSLGRKLGRRLSRPERSAKEGAVDHDASCDVLGGVDSGGGGRPPVIVVLIGGSVAASGHAEDIAVCQIKGMRFINSLTHANASSACTGCSRSGSGLGVGLERRRRR